MKKLLTIFVGFLLFATSQGFAQDNQITAEELRQYIGEKGVYRTRTSKRVKGTPYLNKDFKMGYIMLTEKSRSEDLPLRLNTYDQEIEFARGEEVFAIPPTG
ncbi:MAG: hypothetical protein U5K31_05345 [Balneolaceae bacterium]|nr:hypothetical protein [Balneolaceae bacterium]